ncbi:hypothetical protein HD554DRAFT_1806752 [Boletus coccyginus]|nr:hypothetical protein HD554DRAFT_1806752 [Boletus coccyginus]
MTPSLVASFTYTVRTCPHVVLTRIRSLINPLTAMDDHRDRLTRTHFNDVVRRARKLRAAIRAPTVGVGSSINYRGYLSDVNFRSNHRVGRATRLGFASTASLCEMSVNRHLRVSGSSKFSQRNTICNRRPCSIPRDLSLTFFLTNSDLVSILELCHGTNVTRAGTRRTYLLKLPQISVGVTRAPTPVLSSPSRKRTQCGVHRVLSGSQR